MCILMISAQANIDQELLKEYLSMKLSQKQLYKTKQEKQKWYNQ